MKGCKIGSNLRLNKDSQKRRLTDKIWHFKTIIIRKLVEQYRDSSGHENRPVCFFISIKDEYGK